MPAVMVIWPTMFIHAVTHAQVLPPSRYAQKYKPPAVGYAEASSAMEAATQSVKRLTIGQPTVLMTGPGRLRPDPKSRTAPARAEMIVNEMAKFENPPISRKSCCAYPRRARSRSSCAMTSARVGRGMRLHHAVELPRILAGDLAHDVAGQVPEVLLDVLGRLRPHAVGVRIVGAPHQRLHAHVVDELGADAVELEGALALALPVVARLHREAEVAEAVLPLEVHAIQRVRDPSAAALAERDPNVRITLQHRRADDRGQDIDEVHLEPRDHGEERGAPR